MLTPEHVMRLIIFVQAVAVAYLLIRSDGRNWPWLVAFLFMPQFIENFTVHLRQGCGIVVFLAGWFSLSKVRKWLFMGLSPFVHESFVFVVALCVMTESMKRLRLAEDVRIAIVGACSLLISASVWVVADWLGARQAAEYTSTVATVSGAAFALWLVVLWLMLLEGRTVTRPHAIAVAAIVFYLGTYFFSVITGRIFESTLPLVFLGGLRLTSWRRVVFLWLMVSSGLIGWVMAVINPTISFF